MAADRGDCAEQPMLPLPIQFLVATIAAAINDRVGRQLEYAQEEVRALKEALTTGTDPKELPRLEAKQKQLVRAEEILLERFGRGLITDSVLDKELVRLSKDRTAVKQSIDATKDALRDRPSRGTTAQVLRDALEDLRQKLRFATLEDRRDIVRAVLAKDENAVKMGPERIDARLLLAPRARSGVSQVYRAG